MKKKSNAEVKIRLNKYISQSGLCSRREADNLIKQGQVKVNGSLCNELGSKVNINDLVQINNRPIKPEKNIYILLNKPKDYITSNKDTQNRKIVFDLIKGIKERLFSVGRLDRNTTGVLLLTNDGDIVKKLTHPENKIKKIYSVTLNKKISEKNINQIKNGIVIDKELIKVDKIQKLDSKFEVGIEIHKGKNGVIRKIFESINLNVKRLDRVMFGPFSKKNLGRGKWRKLNESEVRNLKYLQKNDA
tara:strand:- start:17158 stop:17895 length:738 start_codon:yes stop_codon:yes gene_type:complete